MTVATSSDPRRLKVSDWIGGAFVAVIGAVYLAGWLLDIQTFAWFLWTMAIDLVMSLAFLVWWFTRRSIRPGQRLLVLACALLMPVLVAVVSRRAIAQPFFLAFSGLPIALAIWWGWFIASRPLGARARVGGLIAGLAIVWSAFLLVRVDGYRGNLRADVRWRWTPTGEELFLARGGAHETPIAATTRPSEPLTLRPGDWPGFRGPRRDGIVTGSRIDLDWSKSPPRLLWRQRVGPAWSSTAVVDGHAFTQEQRGQREAVVCRDAASGAELWVHEDAGRFEDPMSGPGPRATPAFAGGRIYAQCALGTLNCLDAASGRVIWSRDLRADAGAAMPMWGFCGSPLVVGDEVVIYAGGEGKKGLLAYSLDGGSPRWTADVGQTGYASPQALELGGQPQVLIFTDQGLFAVDGATGRPRWQYATERRVGLPSALQACVVGADALILGNGAAFGAQRIQVSDDGRPPQRQWITPRIKPAFSDMVYHDGFLYGFDGTVFCCVDAKTGERRWREGRYGAGQVLLLAEQGVMIVTSEDGQAILLRCNPAHSEELGRIQAISGKAWNHPAIAGDRLFVRSDAEMACFQLAPAPEGK
ncbi:MAG TPA: PQQ-binding-like beta-propeller repeat protein [Tepidisphaeraceae bacterium]|jgi:outer membrane protein assembly factor BamB